MCENNLVGREVVSFRPTAEHPRQGEGSFLRLKDGRILLVYSRFDFGGDDASPCNLVATWSSDEGETWTEPVVAVAASEFGVNNVMSVSLLEMLNGDVGMFYIVKADSCDNQIWLSRSNDGGKTWYTRHECTLGDRRGYYVLNNDRVIRLKSGRILAPLAFHRGGFNIERSVYWDSRSFCFFLYSDDDGETWKESRDGVYPPFVGSNSGLQEPGVVELQDNVVWAYFRTDMMFHYEAFSFDGGDTWTVAQPSRFTGTCSPLLIRDICGEYYAMWNPTPNYNGRPGGTYGNRTPMSIAKLENGAWSRPYNLEDDPDTSYCYPAMIKVDGGLLAAYMACDKDGVRLTVKKVEL